MRRNVESVPNAPPVDGHERARDYLSEAEFAVLLHGTRQSRHRWRNTAMSISNTAASGSSASKAAYRRSNRYKPRNCASSNAICSSVAIRGCPGCFSMSAVIRLRARRSTT
jgi:hypothetical protein